MASSCEHVNQPLGTIRGCKFLDQVTDSQLLKKDSLPLRRLVDWLVGWLGQFKLPPTAQLM